MDVVDESSGIRKNAYVHLNTVSGGGSSYEKTCLAFGIVLPTQSLIPDPEILDDTYSLQQHRLHQGQKHHKARDFVAGLVSSVGLMASA